VSRLLLTASVVAAASLLAGVALAQTTDDATPALDPASATPSLDLASATPTLDLEVAIEDISGDVVVEQGDDELELDLDADVLFDFGSAELTPEAEATLEEAVARLEELGPGRGSITVIGHTDSIGDPDDNQVLSEARAASVSAVLEASLGDGYTFEVEGRGETEPVAPNTRADGSDNEAGRALNRRVEVVLDLG
jgi:outer membrane protein OmpA-like peptidoglycan-associated protein